MEEFQKYVQNVIELATISIKCIESKKHYIESGCVKYWFQYAPDEHRRNSKTPAQLTNEERTELLSFLREFLDVAVKPEFGAFLYNYNNHLILNADTDEYQTMKKYWTGFCSNKYCLLITFENKAEKIFGLQHIYGLRPWLNGREVDAESHWELTCEWMTDKCTKFINHFWNYYELKKNCNYVKEFTDVHGNRYIRPLNRKIKDVARFGKHYFGIKTIAELKKVSIVGDKNIHGDLCFTKDYCWLRGDASNICGDVTNIHGDIHPQLYGDVSGLSGHITNLTGNATGIKLNVQGFDKPTTIASLLDGGNVVERFRLISNEDNKTLMRVWHCLACHTIGITSSERKLFDNPVKNRPPFSVDKWGRCYQPYDENRIIVISLNPADIMFAKDVNKCSTCFCLNSGSAKWELGMRCLIALNSVNPSLGVAFVIKKDSIKKMNQFNGIKFKWYEPEMAGFFQYNSDGILPFCRYDMLWKKVKIPMLDRADDRIKPIYGHDGINIGHNRQKKLAYLETFIKEGYRWYRGENDDFPLVNNYHDFTMEQATKNNWDDDIKLAREEEKALYEYLNKVKE